MRAMSTTAARRRRGIDTEWFLERITETVGTQTALAERMRNRRGEPLDKASLHGLLHGRRRLALEEAVQLAEALGVPLAQVIEHAGHPVKAPAAGVPLVGLVDDAGRVAAEWDETGGDQVVSPGPMPRGSCAIAVAAGTYQGAILYLGPATDMPSRRCCVVGLHRSEAVVAHVMRTGKRVTAILAWPGISSVHLPADAKVAWYRPVLWTRMP
jgi:hypothetical protein